jgi:hypothetical protein
MDIFKSLHLGIHRRKLIFNITIRLLQHHMRNIRKCLLNLIIKARCAAKKIVPVKHAAYLNKDARLIFFHRNRHFAAICAFFMLIGCHNLHAAITQEDQNKLILLIRTFYDGPISNHMMTSLVSRSESDVSFEQIAR